MASCWRTFCDFCACVWTQCIVAICVTMMTLCGWLIGCSSCWWLRLIFFKCVLYIMIMWLSDHELPGLIDDYDARLLPIQNSWHWPTLLALGYTVTLVPSFHYHLPPSPILPIYSRYPSFCPYPPFVSARRSGERLTFPSQNWIWCSWKEPFVSKEPFCGVVNRIWVILSFQKSSPLCYNNNPPNFFCMHFA